MLKKFYIPIAAFFFIVSQPIFASTITLVNHFPYPITFVSYNPDLTPNFNESFVLGRNGSTSSTVLLSGHECDSFPKNNPSTYLQGTVGNSDHPLDVFFGLGRGCDSSDQPDSLVNVSGFNDTGIAYSWDNNRENAVVVFCTPEDYKAHLNKCL